MLPFVDSLLSAAKLLLSAAVQSVASRLQTWLGAPNAIYTVGRPGPKSGTSDDDNDYITPLDVAGDARVGICLGHRIPEARYHAIPCNLKANQDDHLSYQVKFQGMTPDYTYRPYWRMQHSLSSVQPSTSACKPPKVFFAIIVFSACPQRTTATYPQQPQAPWPHDLSEPRPSPKIGRIAKRSYQRALRRLQQTGTAWYKGRRLEPRSHQHQMRTLSPTATQARILPQSIPRTPRHSEQSIRPCITFTTWNCGGLTALGLEALLQWLGDTLR